MEIHKAKWEILWKWWSEYSQFVAVCFFWAKLLLRKLDISEALSSVGTPGKKTSIILRTAGDPQSKEQNAEIEKSLAQSNTLKKS